MTLQTYWPLLKQTFSDWSEDKAPRLGAALAFYSILSLGPLLLIALAVAGAVFGHDAAQGKIVAQIQGMVGDDGARAIQDMIKDSAEKKDTGFIAAFVGLATLLFGASGVFGELQDAMNTIWEVKPRAGGGIMAMIRNRFLSFSMVFGTGFLLLISLLLSTALSAFSEFTSGYFQSAAAVMQVVNALISFGIVTALFALIFKYLPDAKIAWRDVWTGAAITAGLFTVGKFAIGFYLGHSSFGSSYGAAGSLVVVLVWVYYSAQILFFGAEFTQVYSNRFGKKIEPVGGAVRVTKDERAQQGLAP